MKIVPAEELTDEQWKSYAKLSNAIDEKYDGEQIPWEVLKKERLLDLDVLRQDFLECYLFLENDEAIGWLGVRLILGKEAEFVFYNLYDVIPENVMKAVLEIVLKFISERNRNEILFLTKVDGTVDSFEKAGGEILDAKIFAKLNKSDIDKEALIRIVENVSGKISHKFVLYDGIPDELLDTYLEIYNEARVDMNQNNPTKPVVEKRSKEELIRKLKWDKGPEDKMFVYMLFDNENIAAFCSLFIRVENRHMVDQAGGLTTVGRNYRGQNLARFLKAKMYLKMLDEFPDFEFIRTDTYPWNRHMYRINEEMGFKPYEKYTEMKFKKSQIEKFLTEKN